MIIRGNEIIAQQSVDSYGFVSNMNNSSFRLNSLETNVSNFNKEKDWEFSISSKGNFRSGSNINLNFFSLGKRIKQHYLYARYTPGFQQSFIFNSKTDFTITEIPRYYKTNLNYEEKFGFGYSFDFNPGLTLGMSFRYFQQGFTEEYPVYYTTDSLESLIDIREEKISKNFWRGDFGLVYHPLSNMGITLFSHNLIILNENETDKEKSDFEIHKNTFNLRQNKFASFGINYMPADFLALDFRYETTKSFNFGFNVNWYMGNSLFSFGTSIYHDKYQSPFIAGILPSLNFSSELFSVTLSYYKYFSDRLKSFTLDEFKERRIANIENNFFSSDKLNLTLNFTLSFTYQKKVKFIDVEIMGDIYPTLYDEFTDKPFALAKITNISDSRVSVKPYLIVKELDEQKIYSPNVFISPGDTINIPYYLTIDNMSGIFDKRKITQVNFSLTTEANEPDDDMQKPILINDKNSWDGKVSNLRYFVKNDFTFSHQYASNIINTNSEIKNNYNPNLENFIKTRILFDEMIKNMNYVSDRRATVEYVQFPDETIELKGGDCDDLCVCFSSILESIGIQTAFIDYKPDKNIGHISLMINTKISPSDANLITINDKKYFIRKNITGEEEIWIPLEMTSFTNFEESWKIGAEKFYVEAVQNYGLSKNKVEIVDIY